MNKPEAILRAVAEALSSAGLAVRRDVTDGHTRVDSHVSLHKNVDLPGDAAVPYSRFFEFTVRCSVKDKSGPPDAAAEPMAEVVRDTLSGAESLDYLVVDLEEVESRYERDESDPAAGIIDLSYRATYLRV